jgi:hypothetical protein
MGDYNGGGSRLRCAHQRGGIEIPPDQLQQCLVGLRALGHLRMEGCDQGGTRSRIAGRGQPKELSQRLARRIQLWGAVLMQGGLSQRVGRHCILPLRLRQHRLHQGHADALVAFGAQHRHEGIGRRLDRHHVQRLGCCHAQFGITRVQQRGQCVQQLGLLMETTKTKARRVIPLHPVLAEILKAHRAKLVATQHRGLDSGLVFPSDQGGVRLPSSLQKAWPDLRTALKTDVRVGPQVLRRSLNTNLVLAGVDRITLRSIMGHTSEAMTARYAGVGMDVKSAAVGGLRIVTKPAESGE